MKKIFIIFTLVWLGLISNAFSADFDKGWDAYEAGDYTTALKEWRPLAEQGFASAQYNMGQMYRLGHGVSQDDTEAVKWWHLAAKQGDSDAQFNLGDSYENGDGVIQDNSKAVKWFRLAAEQGHVEAQTNLGLMYALGNGVIEDIVLAHMWSNIAASQGNEHAKKNKDILVKKMSDEEIIEAQRLARQCVKNNYKGC